MEKRTIAKCYEPTFENVTREFLTDILYDILFNEKNPNFKFNFIQKEARDFIEKILEDYTNKYDFFEFRKNKILESIKQGTDNNEVTPVIVVSDYIEFFNQLTKYYEKDIELYFKRTNFSGFQRYEIKNCFTEIWLRMTPEDFNAPENFLRRNVKIIQDNTFEKYSEETYIGELKRFKNYIVCVKNEIARTWDETPFEFKIMIYEKNDYYSDFFFKPHLELPVVRYGICEISGKNVCYIGSIQDKTSIKNIENKYLKLKKKLRNEFYDKKLKSNCYKNSIEPIKLLSLSMFINFLHIEGITEFKVPGMYVLDYEYHSKRSIYLKNEFDEKWGKYEGDIPLDDLEEYEKDTKYLSHNYMKQDVISKLKTETLIMTINALLDFYEGSKVISFPGELDSFFQFRIPISRPTKFNADRHFILIDMYNLIKNY